MQIDSNMSLFSTCSYSHTQSALNELQRRLWCNKCSSVAESPCTLGGCEHIFCRSCVEDFLGKACPVCHIPGHVKDAQVNRQLFHLVKLCQRLQIILHNDDEEDDKDNNKDETEDKGTPNQLMAPWEGTSPDRPDQSEKQKSKGNATHHTSVQDSPCNGKTENLQSERKASLNSVSGEKRSKVRGRRSDIHEQTTMTQFYDYADLEDNETGEHDIENDRNKSLIGQPLTMTTSVDSNMANKRSTRGHVKDLHKTTDGVSSSTSVISSMKCRKNLRTRQKPEAQTEQTVMSEKPLSKPKQRERTYKRHSIGVCLEADNDENTNRQCDGVQEVRDLVGKRSRRSLTSGDRTLSPDTGPGNNTKKTTRQRGKARRSLPASVNLSPLVTDKQPVRLADTSLSGSSKKNVGNTVDKKNAKGETALQVACIKGNIDRCGELLREGANPNTRDNAGWTPLHEACHYGHVKIAELLLDHGALIDVPGTDNDTALHDAICQNKVESVRLLVSRGASITVRNIHGWTPQDLAKTEEMKSVLNTPVKSQVEVTHQMEVDLLSFQPLCFLSTGLSRDQKIVLQKCAVTIQAKVVEEFSPEVTHVITSTNKSGMCPRTIKYMQAIMTGKWILSMEWINMCLEYKEKICEEAFEVPGSSSSPDSQAAQKGRNNRQKQLPGLFDGCQFYFHGNFEYPTPEKGELINLVKLGGARVLTREPKPGHVHTNELTTPYHAPQGRATNCIFIVHDSSVRILTVRTNEMSSVPVTWIMDCVTKFQLLELPDE